MALGLKGKSCFIPVGAVILGLGLVAATCRAGSPPSPAPQSPERKLACPARFITCMTWDKFRHAAWIGTEGHGIYEYRPWARRGQRWLHYSKSNGLSDNSCYAIAVDDKARVWVGTDRHGVDVFLSRTKPWRRYDVLPLAHKGDFGPLGSHPFCIALDPYTRAMWLGTEAGISIYSARQHRWRYLTVANGLPADQINAIGFLPGGKVIVGTQCDGLALGTPSRHRSIAGKHFVLSVLPAFHDPYRWRVIHGPFHTPASAFGPGLPSSLINAISIPMPASPKAALPAHQIARAARHQKIFVGTDSGLAISRNGGATWRFEQGRDYAARVRGLFHPPAGFRSPSRAQLAKLLSGEHITCIARDAAGNLWLGFWRDGYMVISPHGKHVYRTEGDPRFAKVDSYVQAILPLPNGQVLIGRYGHGVSIVNPEKLAKWLKPNKNEPFSRITHPSRMLMPVMVKFPKSAAVPTMQQIIALRNALVKVRPDYSAQPEIIPLDDDWRTRGDWIDRYGRMWSLQYSMTGLDTGSGYDDVCFVRSDAWVNAHWRRGEAARHWLVKGWRNSSAPQTLQDLFHGGRTQANDDDHGETYPNTIDGPNLFQTIALPVGQYVLSAYLFNDDDHWGAYNRCRDYIVQVSNTPELAHAIPRIGWYEKNHIQPAAAFARSRPTAISRCEYFWGGVYKRFFIRVAPAGIRYRGLNMGCVTICIRSNHSFDAICEGLFIDPLGRLPWMHYGTIPRGVPEQAPITLYEGMLHEGPIPPFHRGQPYIPTVLGIPRPGRPFMSMRIKAMPRYAFDAGAVLQQLLYLRHANGLWFAQNGSTTAVELTRFIVGFNGRAGLPAAYLYKRPPQAIYSGRFLASLLRGVGLSHAADTIYPPMSIYMPTRDEYWAWKLRTEHPKITDQQIWPLPTKIYTLYNAWWNKQWHKCLTWEDPQWAKN